MMPKCKRQEASLVTVAADVRSAEILITHQELANALQTLPPHSIYRVTEALEHLMEGDAEFTVATPLS